MRFLLSERQKKGRSEDRPKNAVLIDFLAVPFPLRRCEAMLNHDRRAKVNTVSYFKVVDFSAEMRPIRMMMNCDPMDHKSTPIDVPNLGTKKWAQYSITTLTPAVWWQ